MVDLASLILNKSKLKGNNMYQLTAAETMQFKDMLKKLRHLVTVEFGDQTIDFGYKDL